jgi:hypothetical protein
MSAGFTPGPWTVDALGTGSIGSVETLDGDAVAQSQPRQPIRAGRPDAERIANAHLIAAAPDGFDFADAFLAYIDRSDLDDLDFGRGLAGSGLIEQAKALRAKARGETA